MSSEQKAVLLRASYERMKTSEEWQRIWKKSGQRYIQIANQDIAAIQSDALQSTVSQLTQLTQERDALREALLQCSNALYGYKSTHRLAEDSVMNQAWVASRTALNTFPASTGDKQ